MGGAVVWMIARNGLIMSVTGLAIGALLLIPIARIAGTLLEGFSLASVDPLILIAVGGVLFVVTLAASVIPATKAAKVDPVAVLKTE